ncbi:ABC transporter permease [Fulvivirga sediminis]|uniref:ABC transporter permease n=1 Tax=Fulvivirga sediminis TaxID=2803949 RepID=A0A937FBT6_9BACT|nr:ABC transporter permease [Fulvivirga sediminis]MBL3658304.1 ABC transporter permease [Fulvivirga sediminis]
MFKNIIRIAIRSLLRNKSHSIINVLGLAVGISASLVIFLIVHFNLSFDNHHADKDSIYRLVTEEKVGDEVSKEVGIPFPLRLTFEEDFPEVEEFTMVDNNQVSGVINVMQGGQQVKYKEEASKQAFVNNDYFKIFNYQFLLGDPETALKDNYCVVLSRNLADKYFGSYTEAIGNVVNIENYFDLKVTGIIENPPINTDLPFEMLMSFEIGKEIRIWDDNWGGTSSSTQAYVKLKPGVDASAFSDKIADYISNHDKDNPKKSQLGLQPLADVHFNKSYFNFIGRTITYKSIYTLSIIGAMLLLASCINFVNLNTAMAIKRLREVGVRKVLGSSRGALFFQFLFETMAITGLALLISLGVVELLFFNISALIGYEVPSLVYTPSVFTVLLLFLILVTLLAGTYPAMVLSGYSPVLALKPNLSSKAGSLSFRKVLIVVQLFISQALIMAVIVISGQVDHFLNTPMGINTEAILEFSIPDAEQMKYESFKASLSEVPGVEQVAFSNTGAASENTWGGVANLNDENLAVQVKIIDDSYLDIYDITLLAGRNINMTDSVRNYIVSRLTAEQLGFQDPRDILGRELSVWGTLGPVIGVVEDFSAMPLQYEQQPLAMWRQKVSFNQGSVKVNYSNLEAALAGVKELWQEQFPDYVYSYQFLDNKIESFYKSEKQLASTFTAFAVVALFIGSIGLLGMMSYMVNTRMKEIGIRKVLGAGVKQIVFLLSGNFILLVLLAFVLAAPVSYYFLNNWLSDFTSRITLGMGYFVLTLAVCLIITQLTILVHALKAAFYNPIDILKNE